MTQQSRCGGVRARGGVAARGGGAVARAATAAGGGGGGVAPRPTSLLEKQDRIVTPNIRGQPLLALRPCTSS